MLVRELENFGLTEKEARVYLASLELGTATVQEISQKSNVNRATTYIQVESLLKQGLLSTVDKDKKSLFMAEKPEKLITILEDRRQELEFKEEKIRKLIPDFEALYNVVEDKPRVRFFQGFTGTQSWRADIFKQAPKQMNVILPLIENFDKMVSETDFLEKLFSRIEEIRFLVPAEKKQIMKKWPASQNFKMKYHKIKGFKSELIVYSGKVFISKPIYGKSMSILLEESNFYESFLAMYNHFWEIAEE